MSIKKFFIMLELFSVCFLGGCNNVSGLDEQMIIYGIGVDRNDGDYELTVQALNLQNTEESSQDNSAKNVTTVSATGETLLAAMKQIENQSGKKVLYSHAMILVLSEEAAKSEVGEILRFFSTNHKLRPTAEVLVSSTSAKEILSSENKFNAEDILSATRVGQEKDDTINSKIRYILGDLDNPLKAAKVWYLGYENDEISCQKIAVLKENKLKSVLDEEATKGSLLLLGKAKNISDSIELDSKRIFFELNKVKSNIEVVLHEGKPTFNISLNVDLNVYNAEKLSSNEEIKLAVSERLVELVSKAISVCLKENNCDIFNFHKHVKNNYIDFFKSHESLMDKVLSSSEYNISVKMRVKNMSDEQKIGSLVY